MRRSETERIETIVRASPGVITGHKRGSAGSPWGIAPPRQPGGNLWQPQTVGAWQPKRWVSGNPGRPDSRSGSRSNVVTGVP